MKLLEEALEAQKNGTFPDWYQSLSGESREQFNTELHEIIERVSQSLTVFLRDNLPVVFVTLSQILTDFSEQVKSGGK
jgi:hypothetical protein